MSKLRKASHAGSWYPNRSDELSGQLDGWLAQAPVSAAPARAIIAPHAGYYYCGACGGHAYRQVDPTRVRRIFILGPSHHERLSGCALSGAERYQTPIGDLVLDQQVYGELYKTGMFETMNLSTDEKEHSIEMQLPYIAKVMESRAGQFTIVPVLVGSLSTSNEQKYGQLFSKFLADPDNLFVISSDFCHWGQRFSYTYYDRSAGDISESIEQLDRTAMGIIEDMDPVAFSEYLKKFQNTICGRHPIGVLLNALAVLRKGNGHQYQMKFIQYAQSSKCNSMRDSSVSYASASLTIRS